MLSSVYHRVDKRSGNTYAYESVSFRDPETKKVRTQQTYLGRVDPVTGQVIPKGTNGQRRRAPSDRALAEASDAARTRIEELEAQVEMLSKELERMKSEAGPRDELLRTILAATDRYHDAIGT